LRGAVTGSASVRWQGPCPLWMGFGRAGSQAFLHRESDGREGWHRLGGCAGSAINFSDLASAGEFTHLMRIGVRRTSVGTRPGVVRSARRAPAGRRKGGSTAPRQPPKYNA
jgi:hypothetical protein